MFPTFLLLASVLFLLPQSHTSQLLTLSKQNNCIKSLVYEFISGTTCEKLDQRTKSKLAYRMMNCLFVQMGRPELKCLYDGDGDDVRRCEIEGDAWNTFTTFFAHVDNLCHFYWEVSKAERTEQMIDALLVSSSETVKNLQKNTENTNQILQLQTNLKLQILNSMATQQQMNQIITNSSLTITSLTSQISTSLNKIHSQINNHYTIITSILSAVNQVLGHVDSLRMCLVAEVRSLQGMLFFVGLGVGVLLGCLVSERVRKRRGQCFGVLCGNFFGEFFFAGFVNMTVGVQPLRCVSIVIMILLVVSAKSHKNQVQQALSTHLSSERMNRIVEKALRRQILEIQLKKEATNITS